MKSKNTQQQILDSACEIFAQKGFKDATIAEICRESDANIAAVNYYFRNKQGLYREVWQYTSEISEHKYPSTSAEVSDPYNCLCEHVKNRILSIFDAGPAGWFPRIIHLEMANPSPINSELFDQFIMPRRVKLETLIREMLGADATDQQIRICTINVLSTYAFINIAQKLRKHIFGSKTPTADQLKELISQIQDFVCAAVMGVKASLNQKKKES
jgi:AcrR family transcriptional regulator